MCYQIPTATDVVGIRNKLIAALRADAAHPFRAGAVGSTIICLPDAFDGGICF